MTQHAPQHAPQRQLPQLFTKKGDASSMAEPHAIQSDEQLATPDASTFIEGGFILLAKKIMDSEIWQRDPAAFKIWVYMLMSANYQNCKSKGKDILRGELLTSYDELREAAMHKVGYRTIKPSKDFVKRLLRYLRDESMISVRKTTVGIVITIENYETYQDTRHYTRHKLATMPPQCRPTIRKRIERIKEEKEEREESLVASAEPETPTLFPDDNSGDGEKKLSPKEMSKRKDAIEILEYAKSEIGKAFGKKFQSRGDESRITPIVQRLNKFTVDELKQAVDVMCRDDWEDRRNYCDPKDHLFRGDLQVVKWLEKETANAPKSAEDEEFERWIREN